MNEIALTKELESTIQASHGFLLSMGQVADLLAYPSVQAARRAHVRGNLPVKMSRLPNRRGLFATATQVAEVIASTSNAIQSADSRDIPMTEA